MQELAGMQPPSYFEGFLFNFHHSEGINPLVSHYKSVENS